MGRPHRRLPDPELILGTVARTDQDRPRARARRTSVVASLSLAFAGVACSPEPPYPSLASVPPRPAPSASSEDREALAASLERDRAAARYQEEVVAYETGARATPPQPPPVATPEPPAAIEPVAPLEAQDRSAEAYVEDAQARLDDDGEVGDFMEQLMRPVPGAEGSASAAAAVGLSPGAAVTQTPGGGELVARVAFAAGSLNLPDAAEPALQAAVERMRAGRGRLRIEADGRDESERLRRARTLIVELSRLGATDGQLRVVQGDAGDEARVFLEPAQPS